MLLLGLRGAGENLRLVLSAAGGRARVHLTRADFENPPAPPMFCMLMRKHLTGARVTALLQPPMERLLILELMGRSCNLVLVGADGRIIDCLRRVDMEQSEQRQLLPGLLYRLPPSQDKADFLALGSEGRLALWREAPPDAAADQWRLRCNHLRICGRLGQQQGH